MSEKHELARKIEINWGDLRGQKFIVSEVQAGPEIHDYLVKHFAELGYSPNVHHHHPVYRDTLMQIVAKESALTLTSEATIAAQFPMLHIVLSLSETSSGWRLTENRAMLSCE